METRTLLALARTGDKAARDKLVCDNAGLVWSIVRRFLSRGQEAEDLFQVGNIGLIKAIDRFDLNYAVQFSTYAVPMIAGEIKRFLRDDGMIRVSRSIKENARRIYALQEEIAHNEGRVPPLHELAEALQMEYEEAAEAVSACAEVESLYQPIYQKDGSEICLMDRTVEEREMEEPVLTHMALTKILSELPARERDIIKKRYVEEKKQAEIAKELGVSQVQVSRLLKKILLHMKNALLE